MADPAQTVLAHLAGSDYQPAKARLLARQLEIPEPEYRAFRKVLQALEKEGRIVRLKGGRWALSTAAGHIHGTLEVKRGGFGFLLPDDSRLDDIFIPADCLGTALNGDRVAVRIERRRQHDHRRYGRVEKVLERANQRLVGTVERRGRQWVCLPEDDRIVDWLHIDLEEDDENLRAEEKVLLEITEWPAPGQAGRGRVAEHLGPAGDPDTETAAILAGFQAPGPFPDAVLEEVRSLRRTLTPAEREERLDLRETLCFTIDPEDARDFDDAISVKRTDKGYHLGVHIADVTHFVREGSALDAEARERSTSIYLPGRVIPMLPPELSNDICSLRPREDRLALSVLLELDREGHVLKSTCARTLIHSHRRLTYEEVHTLLEDREAAKAFEDRTLLSALRTLRTLTRKMRANRFAAGSIELNLPENHVVLEDGVAVGMRRVEHDFSHQMVEDCMLAANVAMAQYAAEHGLPVLHRVHDPPEEGDIREMATFLQSYGYNLRLPFSRPKLHKLLLQTRGRPEEHAINLAILKCMNQAIYTPDGREHFALGFAHYTHFTSPIRRYPDLHLHRVLKEFIPVGRHSLPPRPAGRGSRGAPTDLHLLGMHTSGRERRAMKIEGEVKELRCLELLAKSDRAIHKAVVTGIRDFGVFVELEDFYVSSLLPARDLQRLGLEPVEVLPPGRAKQKPAAKRRGRRDRRAHSSTGFHLGQEVVVEVKSVSLSERRCTIAYVPDQTKPDS